LEVLVLLTSNEAVHQTSTLARIAARAGSGATALLELIGLSIYIFLVFSARTSAGIV